MSRRFSHRRGAKREFAFLANGEITACVDLMFTLLIFFMLSSSFVKPVLEMSLPIADSSANGNSLSHPIILTAAPSGQFFVNQRPVAFDQIADAIQTLRRQDPEAAVVFSGDQVLSYGQFVKLMSALKSAGIDSIALEHETSR